MIWCLGWEWLLSCCFIFYFVFCKQKTAYERRISDWSSDVCSSDLGVEDGAAILFGPRPVRARPKGHGTERQFRYAKAAAAQQGIAHDPVRYWFNPGLL